MEPLKNTLSGVFIPEEQQERSGLFANTWFGFFKYLAYRNKGYFQRRALNLVNELIEFGCLALVLNPSLMRSLILIPLGHILINYLQEYHWQLYRTIPDHWWKKKITPIDLALWAASAGIILLIGARLLQDRATDPVILALIPIRLLAVLIQLALAPRIARLTSFRRVRPNLKWIWGGSSTVWLLCFLPLIHHLDLTYVFWVTGLFNLNKIVQECLYFKIVEAEKHKLRLVLPKIHNRGIHPEHFLWMLAMVALHLALIGMLCLRFRLEHSRVSPLVIFFLVTMLDRVNGRTIRSLALDFDQMRKRRLKLLTSGLIRRALGASLLLLALTEGYLLHQRNLSFQAIFGLAYVAIQGLLNQIWIYTSIGADEKGVSHRARATVLVQILALFPLFMKGRTGIFLFFALGGLNLATSLYGIFKNRKAPPLRDGKWIQFDWVPTLPHWPEFRGHLEENGIPLVSLDRRKKMVRVKDHDEWKRLVEQFPLNLKNWSETAMVPEPAPIQIPPNARIAVCDPWGFWRYPNHPGAPSEEDSFHLHYSHRDWKEYPFLKGMKRSWKLKKADGTEIHAGPADLNGEAMWVL